MNDGKLCGLVVLLCVICPILVGFVWPVGTTTEQGWETGDPINISNDVINSDISVFTRYNDPFNNNMNVFSDTTYANEPVTTTTNPGPVWDVGNPSFNVQTVTTDALGFYTISDISTWKNWASLQAKSVVFAKTSGWDEIDLYGGWIADIVVYYPESDQLFFRVDGSDEFRPFDVDREITFSASTSSVHTENLYYLIYETSSLYANLADGFEVPLNASWFNGYQNKAANIIFSTNNNSRVDLIFFDYDQVHSPIYDIKVSIRVSSGSISMNVYENNVLIYSEILGNNSVYDKVLLNYDYDKKAVSLSGLKGMTSYIGDYQGAIRETITCNLDNPIIFYSFNIQQYSGYSVWYVADTVSGVSSTPGSHDYFLNLRDYSATGSLQINLRSVQIHSDDIAIIVNSTAYVGTIEGNTLTIRTDDGYLTVPLNNLIIGLIDNKVYLNGNPISDLGTFVSSATIRFYGDWLMSVYLYHMEPVSVEGYTWLAGGFGLDVMGFCSVGLITSVGSALGLGLYGRRSGMRIGLVTMTALFCAAAYLIFMMNGGI